MRSCPARALLRATLIGVAVSLGVAAAQRAPDADLPLLRPELLALTCPERTWTQPPTEAQRLAAAQRDAFRALLPEYLARVPAEPDEVLAMPVDGVRVAQVADTWGAPRGGRLPNAQLPV